MEDSDPSALEVVGSGLVRDLQLRLDAAYFGNTTSNGPNELGHLTGVTTVAGGTITDLDAFVVALSEAEQIGAQLTAFVAHHDTVLSLSTLKIRGGSTSNPCSTSTRPARRDDRASACRLYPSPASPSTNVATAPTPDNSAAATTRLR